jgi:oxygen-independent coproporphyrinogen III oxidase
VIERLMCDLAFSGAEVMRKFGAAANAVVREAMAMVEADREGLIERTADGFTITERGRPFIRGLCARFDGYLGRGAARHAVGV